MLARTNFKWACKNFSIKNGQSTHSKAMASHKGKNSTYSKISESFFWYSIYKDVESYIKSCKIFQKQGDLKLKMNSKLHSIPVPSTL